MNNNSLQLNKQKLITRDKSLSIREEIQEQPNF